MSRTKSSSLKAEELAFFKSLQEVLSHPKALID